EGRPADAPGARRRRHPSSRPAGARRARRIAHPVPTSGSSDLSAHLAQALREAPDPFVDLRRRERTEGQAEEALAAAVREEGEAVGEVQVAPGRGGAGARGGAPGG